MRTSI